MPPISAPKGLRVICLRDRLLLHDITFALRSHPSNRNALIDAANTVHRRDAPTRRPPNLLDLDLPTHPAIASASDTPAHHRYLVLPFAQRHNPQQPPVPYVAHSAEQAGLTADIDLATVPTDAAAAFLGLLPLHSGVFAVLATQVRRAGTHPTGSVLSLAKVRLVRLGDVWQSKEDKDAAAAVAKLLESGAVYYSLHTDLTLAAHHRDKEDRAHTFCWNYPLTQRLPHDIRPWAVRAIYGFVDTQVMRFQSQSIPSPLAEFCITLISRRSRLRAGTRYITRGVDALGNVANFVETEQVVWRDDQPFPYSSFLVIRGSVPIYWRQNNGIAKPSPELDGDLVSSRRAFARHFDALKDKYGYVSAVSLVDQQGSEGVLAQAFERHFELYLKPFDRELPPRLAAFDFHTHCSGKEYDRGLALLLDRLRSDVSNWGFFVSGKSDDNCAPLRLQQGVFRVNCVDCLDRTNVVQSMIARVVLFMQLEALFEEELTSTPSKYGLRLFSESEDRYKHLWGDNADAVSKQYSGTGALKTDFTRTGKRSTTGVIGDGVKSVMRMYYKNFVDEGRQEVIDVLCGTVAIRHPVSATGESDSGSPGHRPAASGDLLQMEEKAPRRSKGSSSLWYSFEALRINAGGDKQQVYVELHDDYMNVVTPDSICLEFPRNTLVSWSKRDDGKPSDRKIAPAQLRLLFSAQQASPATASPLDLQFRGGSTARENFLRALISWARPDTASLLAEKPVRVRVIAAQNAGEHKMADWGLAPHPDAADIDEIIALVLPEGNKRTRSWGLAAVPIDVDFSDYCLVGACSVHDQGPSIAVLTSKRIVPTVMMVSESTTRKSVSPPGGMAAIALQACGTSFCFVSVKASTPGEVYAALTTLKLGRQSFDVTNQYHHFAMAGLLGDVKWHHSKTPAAGVEGRQWVRLDEGSFCYTLDKGLSIMRNSFPTLTYNDKLNTRSLWTEKMPSTGFGNEMKCYALADGVVQGRRGPQLPKQLSKSMVRISKLRAEDLLMPKGIEVASQMNSFIVLYCDLATMEGITTRTMQRPSLNPQWRDTLSLVMMPSDIDEIHDSFILGQIMIPAPLGEPILAGQFVLPISFAKQENGEFQVPCRLAGKLTARLFGRINVGDGEWGMQGAMEKLSMQTPGEGVPRTGTSARNSLPPIPSPESSSLDSMTRRPYSTNATEGMDGYSGRTWKKGTMDEMNGRLNAAKKKGSKQMKSVVNKLSSFLNQPTPSSATGKMGRASSVSNFGGQIGGSDGGVSSVEAETSPPSRSDVSEKRVADLRMGTGLGGTRAQALNGHGGGEADKKARVLQSFQDDKRFATRDALLSGLEANRGGESMQKTSKQTRASTAREQPVGVDALLNGLMDERHKPRADTRAGAMAEDDWGDFEKAASPEQSRSTRSGPPHCDDGPSLIDL